jgi:hypothetical protein
LSWQPYIRAGGLTHACSPTRTKALTPLAQHDFADNLLKLLKETFEAGGDFYLESGAGLFPTLDTITAEIASREPFPGAPSIAAHCAHLDYYVRVNHSSIVGREQRSTGHRVGAFKASELASGRPSSRVCGAATSI